jgi:hypothetical protein
VCEPDAEEVVVFALGVCKALEYVDASMIALLSCACVCCAGATGRIVGFKGGSLAGAAAADGDGSSKSMSERGRKGSKVRGHGVGHGGVVSTAEGVIARKDSVDLVVYLEGIC